MFHFVWRIPILNSDISSTCSTKAKLYYFCVCKAIYVNGCIFEKQKYDMSFWYTSNINKQNYFDLCKFSPINSRMNCTPHQHLSVKILFFESKIYEKLKIKIIKPVKKSNVTLIQFKSQFFYFFIWGYYKSKIVEKTQNYLQKLN